MAKIYNVHDAKSNLSKLIEEVLAGEDVTIARAGVPVVDLSVHHQKRHFPGFLSHMFGEAPTLEEQKEIFAAEPYDPWAGEDLTKWQ